MTPGRGMASIAAWLMAVEHAGHFHGIFSGATASLLGGPAAGAEDCEHAHCALVRLLERPCRFGEQGFAAGDDLNYVAVTVDHKNAFERLETPECLQNFRDHDSKSG